MKLSLAWVFDHIDADWKKLDIPHLVAQFNRVVAEIEGIEKVSIDLSLFSLAQVRSADAQTCTLFSPEWNQECTVPARKGIQVGAVYVIKKSGKEIAWATAQDLGSGKDMALPALHATESDLKGNWKQSFESQDYIIELDNKSVTNRPDMWGHRGFAREIAAMLELPLKPQAAFLADKKITQYDYVVQSTSTNPITIINQAPQAAKRFAGVYLGSVKNQPSLLWMLHRLVRIDARPIDALVDMTNYVMFDCGQPMHAFDAAAIEGKKLTVRMAKNKEKLTLLDGETIELCSEDLVIADQDKPLGLAGIMGGKESGINASTTAILLESACFDATTIRKSSTRYRKRTEASARFEKSLDPNNNTLALQRFLQLMHDAGIRSTESDEIFSLGAPAQPLIITIEHSFIEKRLGVTIAPEFIQHVMQRLEIGVQYAQGVYTLSVPSFRSTKDVRIKEDIVEEIGRFYGYTSIEPQLPRLELKPANLSWVYRQRMIKNIMAYSMKMRELYSYAFFDEEFLASIKWNPGNTLEVKSPVSENWRRLVTTLIPGLLKAVITNSAEHDALRFFELGRVWHTHDQIKEKKSFAGIMFDKKNINFYDAKSELEKLFAALKMDISWAQVAKPEYPWYAPYQTADLMYNNTKIGVAGKVSATFLSALCPGDMFIYELDADFMLNHKEPLVRYQASSKYPEMIRDISILIARDISAQAVGDAIQAIDTKIISVSLLDFFEKPEWPEQRAMTFRFVISDNERTMTKEEADGIWDRVAHELKSKGAVIR
jgi:phenylalanyl-tRNA synthetase beta chain